MKKCVIVSKDLVKRSAMVLPVVPHVQSVIVFLALLGQTSVIIVSLVIIHNKVHVSFAVWIIVCSVIMMRIHAWMPLVSRIIVLLDFCTIVTNEFVILVNFRIALIVVKE